MLRRHHHLTARITSLQKLHKQLPSAGSQVHTRAKPEHLVGMILHQQEQQAASKGAACSSGMSEGCKVAGRSYRQCKQEGSRYGRQWEELRRQHLFLHWTHKPEQLEVFTG